MWVITRPGVRLVEDRSARLPPRVHGGVGYSFLISVPRRNNSLIGRPRMRTRATNQAPSRSGVRVSALKTREAARP